MNLNSKMDWQKHLLAGQRYLSTATKGLSRRSVFNNALIYQLTAMAIEHLLVSVYRWHGQMPIDHTLDGLVDGLSALELMAPDLAEQIKGLGRYDDMCPLVPVNPCIPDDTEIKAILAVGRQVVGFAELNIKRSLLQKAG